MESLCTQDEDLWNEKEGVLGYGRFNSTNRFEEFLLAGSYMDRIDLVWTLRC